MPSKRDKKALKEAVIAARDYWHPFHDGLLEMSPAYLEAYLDFQDAPARSNLLEPKVREFIYIAADAAISHLYASGLARHIDIALKKGATREEVLEVIMLTMLTSHSTHDLAVPILVEEMRAVGLGRGTLDRDLSADEQKIKDDHIQVTGSWPVCGDALLRLAPVFVKGFLAYAAVPYGQGPLAPKIKDFIRIAVCAAPTNLDALSLRTHIRSALKNGASGEEIAEVLQLTSAISIHTCTAAIPALMAASTSTTTKSGK